MATRYEYYDAVTLGQTTAYDARWEAQTFTPSIAHTITSVKFRLARIGLPGTITASIRDTSGGEPVGGDLRSGTINGNSLPEFVPFFTHAFVEITLGAGTLLSASTQYAIVLKAPDGDVNNRLQIKDDISPAYSGGTNLRSMDSGGTWAVKNIDLPFEDWGDPVIVAPTVTTDPATAIR